MEAVFNRHLKDFKADFTLEFNVKNPNINIPSDLMQYEWETGTFTNMYCQRLFEEINKSNYKWLKDWSFAGRSNGWFCLICEGQNKVRVSTVDRIKALVKIYFNNYSKELRKYYEV